MINIRFHKFFFINLFIGLFAGFLTACASNNRPSHITSIGHEDLTSKKPVNVIIYHDKNQKSSQASGVFKQNAQRVIVKLKHLDDTQKLSLNNIATHEGPWLEVADNYFSDDDYNWTIKLLHSNLPEIRFQNYSTDIDSSIEVHFRYCKERTIQFANISAARISADQEYWLDQFYPLAIHSLYLLMKGNTELVPVEIRDYQGRPIDGTLLGETDDYRFILNGETHIYITPKTDALI